MTTENWIDLPTMQNVAKAKADEWEVTYCHELSDKWDEWKGSWWDDNYTFRGRPRQPVMKEVKLECWLVSGRIEFLQEQTYKSGPSWKRQPHLDMVANVPE